MIFEAPLTAESLECLQAIKTVGSSLKKAFPSNIQNLFLNFIPGTRETLMLESFPTSSPFFNLKISNQEPLRRAEIDGRSLCSSCKRSVKYFCYRCVRMVEALENDSIPQVSLPINMKILKHEQELDSKSTAIHAKLLAPTQISIHQFRKSSSNNDGSVQSESYFVTSDLIENIILDPTAYVILFPDETAVELKNLSKEEFQRVKNVIVIDGTWSQAAAINRTDPYSRLRRIKINPNLRTVFWRYQDLGEHCLSTIEAIYFFMKEFSEVQMQNSNNFNEDDVVESCFISLYDGRFDNLLYFFSFFYHLIQRSYLNDPDRKYTSRHRSDYIKRN